MRKYHCTCCKGTSGCILIEEGGKVRCRLNKKEIPIELEMSRGTLKFYREWRIA